MEKTQEEALEYWRNRGVEILEEVPEGWTITEGTLTEPIGYRWCSNGKSRFGGERKTALIKIKDTEKTARNQGYIVLDRYGKDISDNCYIDENNHVINRLGADVTKFMRKVINTKEG